MRIAVNTHLLQAEPQKSVKTFVREVFFRLANAYPEHEFIFFFHKPVDGSIDFPGNVKPVVIRSKGRSPFLFRWWYDVKIPLALKKYKADVLVSPGGVCSLLTSVRQILVIHDLAFLHHPEFIPRRQLLFYKWYTPRFVKKANVVATTSAFSAQEIVKRYRVPSQKVMNVQSAVTELFHPLEWEEKEAVKDKYTDGCEYFVFTGGLHPRHNLMNLLKAFSIFKRWQKTNMKLVVTGDLEQQQGILEKLKTYKYRDEVKLLGNLPEADLPKVIASAYAMVFPSFYEDFPEPLLQAMQSGVPVITSQTSSMPEVAGNAVLYIDPSKPAEIADQMKKLFKDEALRGQMIRQAKEQAQNFSWEKTASLVWKAIEQAVSA